MVPVIVNTKGIRKGSASCCFQPIEEKQDRLVTTTAEEPFFSVVIQEELLAPGMKKQDSEGNDVNN